ncbi:MULTISPECIES: hypothetical protein [Idiomarina]|jgi:hypothetical protein|uniref:YqaE/Pmp3 family membrane protein n=1 Tax=Idiomarina abyssalis TaxID=86102 RepID=A0A8I1KI39_9GAMM|nr:MULTISPECIES: hypothetical protein [Idiomarina]RDX34511.1 YqaE/Pmp3 family membrane protein [Idiomarina sp. HD9-110m-PIT-SAG05]KPD20937.1 membrane protein [Idiomarina abyssalis]MAB22387.1 YqaE/Pmp3 family membrane protein [Idiomarina sp.]MAL84638.1 YqaE/Pmp3 family membrane protein [Idiomarina sp.]MAO67032.1 YqaE/Pmp3 family membrane protein [Idiomarina sp.]|tara:strand:- start:789 stop:1028 length:240 start_codon:yes stop_codon:yes gene_type:complete
MLYILAILFPPIAILFTGKIFQAIFNAIIAIIGVVLFIVSFGALGVIYLVAIIHAIIAVHDYRQTKRDERLIKAARGDK